MSDNDYIKCNQQWWNANVKAHVASDFYGVEAFLNGKSSLNDIELQLLGNIEGKSILHLQCHFGMDSISLARMGAKVTGIDFSEPAIEVARELAIKTEVQAQFICCDVYSLPQHLDNHFDMVFTSYGVIGWLPNLQQWAYLISKYLKPGGCFVMAEFHPVVWMFDNNFIDVAYRYFQDAPIIETQEGSYANRETDEKKTSISWNHSLSEVINNLISQGLQLSAFYEYDYSPYHCFQDMDEIAPGRFQTKRLGNKIPMVYSLKAQKVLQQHKSASRGI